MKGGGFDEIVDGFSLGEVETIGDEGSLGEFTGFGETRAGEDASPKEMIEEDG